MALSYSLFFITSVVVLLQLCAIARALGTQQATPTTPSRLTVNGSKLLDSNGTAIRLTGFNWQIFRAESNAGELSAKYFPKANVARLVGVLWGNTHPLAQDRPKLDCMTLDPPNYFNDACFEFLDPWVKSATDAGLWVVLAVRGEYVAGQLYASDPGGSLFRNATLRSMAYAMWKHVASHYASFERIAAYEILSEPRDKEADPASVRSFYEGGCRAAIEGDPRTPCLVGSAPYYKLYSFSAQNTLLGGSDLENKVIYTFDYFNPDSFVFGETKVPTYGSGGSNDTVKYPCSSLYKGWSGVCSSLWNLRSPSDEIPFDARWHRRNLGLAAAVQSTRPVPLFMNQFEVVHGVSSANGRFAYIEDLVGLAKEMNIGWAWWTLEGGNSGGWKHGSSEVLFKHDDGTIEVDDGVAAALEQGWD